MKKTFYWMGMAEFHSGTVVVIGTDEQATQIELFRKWRISTNNNEWISRNKIFTFEALKDWNGASVKKVKVGESYVWEQI